VCDVQQVLRGLLVCGVNASFWLDGPTSVILIQMESSPHVLRGTEETTAARLLLLCHNAMVGLLEFEPAAAPATILESESTGRERRARGFYFGDSGHGKQRLAMAAAAAMAMASRSSWGALLGQREGLPRVGAGKGRCGGAHLERNRTKMA